MSTRVVGLFLVPLALCLGAGAHILAQSSMQPTPPPEITAESRDWYSSGDPIAFGGNVYHQSGPVIHFLRNEMVLAGMFDGVPIYVRTTREPGSIIYVPLSGGVMRPYERRRTGELAGTVGSTVPAFPVVLPSDQSARSTPDYVQAPPETAAMPVGTSGFIMERPQADALSPAHARSVGGRPGELPAVSRPAGPLRTAHLPVGLDDVYVDYGGRRWFLAGPAVEYSDRRFTRIGEYQGFSVYAGEGRRGDVIYVPLLPGSPGLVTPYRAR